MKTVVHNGHTSLDSMHKLSVYSDGEIPLVDTLQCWRDQLLLPLLRVLSAWHVTPNELTYLSLICGIVSCGLFIFGTPIARLIAFLMLTLHLVFDGIDGPLARYTQTASNQGTFTDATVDQLVVALSTLALIRSGIIGILPGGLYLFFYTIVVVFAMVRSFLGIPYHWLLRPRMVVYGWFVIEIYLLPGTINYLLWGCTVLLGIEMFSGFLTIRKEI